MSEVISLINEKGGVGKSSSAITIAQILSISGYSILLIDLDPQMNTSKMFGKSEEGKDIDYEQLFCSKFDDKATVMNYISTTDYENISILCASRELNNLIYKIYDESKESNVELCFKHNLSLLKDDYDYIIIDNSPFLFSLPRTGVQRGLDIPRKGLQSSLSATVSCRVKGICSFPKEGKKKSPEVVRGSPLPDRLPP